MSPVRLLPCLLVVLLLSSAASAQAAQLVIQPESNAMQRARSAAGHARSYAAAHGGRLDPQGVVARIKASKPKLKARTTRSARTAQGAQVVNVYVRPAGGLNLVVPYSLTYSVLIELNRQGRTISRRSIIRPGREQLARSRTKDAFIAARQAAQETLEFGADHEGSLRPLDELATYLNDIDDFRSATVSDLKQSQNPGHTVNMLPGATDDDLTLALSVYGRTAIVVLRLANGAIVDQPQLRILRPRLK